MIPFVYRLKEGVRIQERGGSYLVISEVPLNVVRINQAAAKILRLSDGSRTLEEIGEALSGLSAEDAFPIAEYFLERGFLERAIRLDEDFRPFVSVIIPTRDRQRDLAECLTSIFAQDYPKNQIEVIVFDDGSKDQTRALVPKFPCTLLLNERSKGASFCRNAGARLARGEILAFLVVVWL